MPTRILLQLLLLAGLAVPLGAFALGVGPLTVRSALNQNFEAEIPLIVNNPAELVGLTADSIRIPRQQVFTDMGVEPLEFRSKLRFAVQTNPGGASFIKVTSVQPIREPSFDLLIEVVWPRGRLLRTFPVHLDPELYADRQAPPPPPVEMPRMESPAVAVAPADSRLPPPASPVSFEGASLYGPVKRGENLTRIAEKVRPSPAISVPDMMAILVAGNPQAFTNGNPSTLRVGATLKVPSPQALGTTGALAPVPDIAAVTPVEPQTSPQLSPVETPAPSPVAETPPVAQTPPVTETPPTSLAPPQEIIPQVTVPLEPPPPVVDTKPLEPPPPVVDTKPLEPPPVVDTKPLEPTTPLPAAKPVMPPQETGMNWLSNPVVWIAIALIVLAVGAVLLLPLLRRQARPKTTVAIEEETPQVGAIAADVAEPRTSAVRKPDIKPGNLVQAAAVEETAATPPPPVAEPVAKPAVRPVPKVAAPPPKPIDELLKDIDFSLGDERSQPITEGKGASRGGAARRMPDTEPPTASVTRTNMPLPPPAPVKPIQPAPIPAPAPALEPLSELPSGLQLDKLEFDLGDLGLESTRKPAELPPLELKPVVRSTPADDLASTIDLNLPDFEPMSRSTPAAKPEQPKASDFKFEFTDVSQQSGNENLMLLEDELRSFGDGGFDLGKMELSLPPGGGDAGADYVETKLDLAAAYLDMGDQVGARGLLDDVLKEGDAAQKQRAEDLLKKLG